MSSQPNMNSVNSVGKSVMGMKEDFVISIILGIVLIISLVFIFYLIYLSRLQSAECSYMNSLYPKMDGYIRPINANDPDCSLNLYAYEIKTAFHACSGGSLKNDYVNICNLKAVINQGVRCLDFQIFNINDEPVVATSTSDSYYVRETFNYVNFSDVMKTISDYAFSNGTAPNYTDPLLIHLRIMSTEQKLYTNLANIFKKYDNLMLGNEYSYENNGLNIGAVPLLTFQNQVIVIVDKINSAYLENTAFLEYVNLTSNSVFMRALTYYDVQNTPDLTELQVYNERDMSIVFPNDGSNPGNPNGITCREAGCQMIAMRYQYVDTYLEDNASFFDEAGYAFVLKPERLRYNPVTIPDPTPQNPQYSYATRTASSDYYNFNY